MQAHHLYTNTSSIWLYVRSMYHSYVEVAAEMLLLSIKRALTLISAFATINLYLLERIACTSKGGTT